MTIIETNTEILTQLQALISQLKNKEYSKKTAVLSDNTIGKHVRHILEFYSCLLIGISNKVVDYDKRERNLFLETDANYANAFIDDLKHRLSIAVRDKPLQLDVCFSENSDEKTALQTTYYRELAYNIEHAIHHMAIIKIAIVNEYKHIEISNNFGVAYSTIKHQQTQCVQ